MGPDPDPDPDPAAESDSPPDSEFDPDLAAPEGRYEFLRRADVFVEEADGRVAVTEAFDATRGIYHDTYGDADEETFHGTVASLFDLTVPEARERIEALGITRAELVGYLALRSHLDDAAPGVDLDRDDLVRLAAMVAEVAPVSPVPDGMRELTDGDYRSFLDAHPDAVVFVWRRHCDPCDAMKAELDAVLAAVPDGVAVAGVDGEAVDAFRAEFEVDTAPTTLAFAGGRPAGRREGRASPGDLDELFADAFAG